MAGSQGPTVGLRGAGDWGQSPALLLRPLAGEGEESRGVDAAGGGLCLGVCARGCGALPAPWGACTGLLLAPCARGFRGGGMKGPPCPWVGRGAVCYSTLRRGLSGSARPRSLQQDCPGLPRLLGWVWGCPQLPVPPCGTPGSPGCGAQHAHAEARQRCRQHPRRVGPLCPGFPRALRLPKTRAVGQGGRGVLLAMAPAALQGEQLPVQSLPPTRRGGSSAGGQQLSAPCPLPAGPCSST